MQNRFFRSLQIYRGVAAMMVVFHHLWNNLAYYYQLDFQSIDVIASCGKFGVDFFFILSGFIICYSNYELDSRPSKIGHYIKNRILRIYIPYLPIGILMLVMYQLMPGVSGNVREINLYKSIFLIPIAGNTALSVAWTLVFELFFYTVFILWFISKRYFVVFIILWAVLIAYLNLFLDGSISGFVGFIGSYYNIEFITGIVAAFIYKSGKYDKRIMILLIVITIVALFMILPSERFFIHLMVGIVFGSLLLVSIGSFLDRLTDSNLLMLIGNASYSIYLIHNPIISILFKAFRKFEVNFVLFFILAFIICIVAGLMYSSFFEQYIMRKVKKKLE